MSSSNDIPSHGSIHYENELVHHLNYILHQNIRVNAVQVIQICIDHLETF